MIGCQFCGVEENGDIINSLKPLLQVRPMYEAAGEDFTVSNDELWSDAMGVRVGVYDGWLAMFIGNGTEALRKINCCPMCGRKF